MPVKAKYIKDLPLKEVLDGSESLLVQDLNGTQQAPLGTIVDEIKQNSQEKIREIESELAQTNAQLSRIEDREVVVSIKDFGAKGDGVTDDSEAFRAMLEYVNKLKCVKIMFPKGEYYIGDCNTPQNPKPNFTYSNFDSIKIDGENAKIRMNGDFHRAVTRTQNDFDYSDFFALTPFEFVNSNNISINNIYIDGGLLGTTKDSTVVESPSYGFRFNGCENIKIENCVAKYCGADGIIFFPGSELGNGRKKICRNVEIINFTSEFNGRQGMTIGHVANLHVLNSSFSNIGNVANYGGHAPRAGIDFEQDWPSDMVEEDSNNIKISNCKLVDNIQSLGFVGTKFKNVVIETCNISTESNFDMQITLRGNISFVNNIVKTPKGAFRVGEGRILVQNNTIESRLFGTYESSSAEIMVRDNKITTFTKDSIWCKNAKKLSLIGNYFFFDNSSALTGYVFPWRISGIYELSNNQFQTNNDGSATISVDKSNIVIDDVNNYIAPVRSSYGDGKSSGLQSNKNILLRGNTITNVQEESKFYKKGDIILNKNVDISDGKNFVGKVCISSSVDGTWEEFGHLKLPSNKISKNINLPTKQAIDIVINTGNVTEVVITTMGDWITSNHAGIVQQKFFFTHNNGLAKRIIGDYSDETQENDVYVSTPYKDSRGLCFTLKTTQSSSVCIVDIITRRVNKEEVLTFSDPYEIVDINPSVEFKKPFLRHYKPISTIPGDEYFVEDGTIVKYNDKPIIFINGQWSDLLGNIVP